MNPSLCIIAFAEFDELIEFTDSVVKAINSIRGERRWMVGTVLVCLYKSI